MQPHSYQSRKLLTLCLVILLSALILKSYKMNIIYNEISHLYYQHHVINFYNEILLLYQHHIPTNVPIVALFVFFIIPAFGYTSYVMSRSRPVYLVDHATYKAPDHLQVKLEVGIKLSKLEGSIAESSIDFQRKILERSGLGEETCLPECFFNVPFKPTLSLAREEAEQVMFGALDNLFKSTNVNPKEIEVLVVNCSLFNPTPSLSAMIINRYKLRGNIKSFNLGGMGCSAGVIAIDLAKDMLKVHINTYALVVSTENLTLNSYRGNNKSMMLPNCLFRMGASAVLLSNKSSDKGRAKYKLLHVVRTNMAANNDAYKCVFQEQDEEGIIGVSLSKNLMTMAAKSLKTNIAALGPLVLPFSEQLFFFVTYARRKWFGSKIKLYMPDFKLALDHFCIHAGGRAVIDELEKNLQLLPVHVEASRMTLHRFGNTSSSSIWYELAYTEAKGRVQKGDRVWQIAFGSGFKCNSAVWKALRNVKASPNNPWEHFIDKYPVEITKVA